jgi:sterol desaturase/sphingolipid hydroxylase (fatty acid hydroxylase superfamily)
LQLVLALRARHHDLHHERMKCNYSSPFVDYVMGTYLYREPDKIYPKFDKEDKSFTESHNTTCVEI